MDSCTAANDVLEAMPSISSSARSGNVSIKRTNDRSRSSREETMSIESGLLGKRALVTGSSSGIGFATAAMMAEAGVPYVVINGRAHERGEAARRAILARAPQAEVAFVAADLSSPDGARKLVESAAGILGGTIDMLVNAAGGDYTPRPFHQTSVA